LSATPVSLSDHVSEHDRNSSSADRLGPVVATARTAQSKWAGCSVAERLRPVRAFRHLLAACGERLDAIVAREVGKKPGEALASEVLPTADACRFLEREAAALLRPRKVSGWQRPIWLMGQSDTVYRRPRGVVGILGTWNYPLYLNAVQIIQAVTAGNAVLWKPSEVTPAFAEQLHELLLQAGFPADLIQRLPATREMGPALAEADIDHVVFTGSVSVGRTLATRLGQRLISSTLELSGCDLQLVLEDAPVEMAAHAAWFGATVNRGQTCIAVRRAFVQRSIYPAFCEALRQRVAAGVSAPLTLDSQAQQAQRLIRDAVEQGARLLGGDFSSPEQCRPAVLLDASPHMAVCREASFAPVLAVLPFDTVQEALTADQLCPLALGASIFTRNLTLARQLSGQLRAGSVTINDVIVPTAHPATPFGGRHDSGWGTTQGAEGLLEMTVPQTVSVRSGTFRPHYDQDDPKKAEWSRRLLIALLQASHAPQLSKRLAGWWQVVRIAMKGPSQ
jgi:acyl-CoA reductase-like NAD-dependent aldehyde dehydrogenase